MANEKKIDVVILGFLYHEPMSGYDIKKRIDNELKYFFSGSYGSIYPALNTLEQSGLVTKEEISEGGRGRTIYSISKPGEDYLKSWLNTTTSKDGIRYETLLKMFFGGAVGRETTLLQIKSFEEKVGADLRMLEFFEKNLERVIDQSEDHLYFLLTVRFGIETYKAHLKWCEDAREMLKE